MDPSHPSPSFLLFATFHEWWEIVNLDTCILFLHLSFGLSLMTLLTSGIMCCLGLLVLLGMYRQKSLLCDKLCDKLWRELEGATPPDGSSRLCLRKIQPPCKSGT